MSGVTEVATDGRATQSARRRWSQALGPGLITGASDDDPSGVAIYSPQVGGQFGYGQWWPRRALWRSSYYGSAVGHRAATASGQAFRLARRAIYAAVVTVLALSMAAPTAASTTENPEGTWLVDSNSALQIFDCSGLLCGRVGWLKNVREADGKIRRDRKNPDPTLRERLVCGLTVLWGLQSVGTGSWKGGWFYNPDDGKTYRAAAELHSMNTLVARIYLGVPLLGETKTLVRMPQQSSDSRC